MKSLWTVFVDFFWGLWLWMGGRETEKPKNPSPTPEPLYLSFVGSERILATATPLWERDGRLYCLTARHVVSSRPMVVSKMDPVGYEANHATVLWEWKSPDRDVAIFSCGTLSLVGTYTLRSPTFPSAVSKIPVTVKAFDQLHQKMVVREGTLSPIPPRFDVRQNDGYVDVAPAVGWSGAPVIHEDGFVLGMLSSTFSRGARAMLVPLGIGHLMFDTEMSDG